MNLTRIPAWFVALAVLVAAGCGTETGTNPEPMAPSAPANPLARFVPVETDFVVALDVSDSTDAAELAASVDALVAVIEDETVFDLDGSASAAIIAYADTVATVVGPLTVIDPTTLSGALATALADLQTTRPVAGGSARADFALESARELLAAGAAANQHVLVVGGSRDVPGDALDVACDALAGNGVRVHAIALNAPEAEATALQACADATGGAFAAVDALEDLTDAMRLVVSTATVVDLALDPETIERVEGESAEFTATVTRGVDDEQSALEGIEIVFTVTEGPNAGVADTSSTDAEGTATFSYVGALPGVDTVEARTQHPDGTVDLVATATVTWAEIVYALIVAPETAELDRGAEHTVVATVTEGVEGSEDPFVPVEGVEVIFAITEGPSAGLADTLLTSAEGFASITFSSDLPGVDTITATIPARRGDETIVAQASATWLNAVPVCDAGGPYAATVEGDSVRVMLDASASSDADGDPLTFTWSVSDPGLEIVDADTSSAVLVITGDATCADAIEIVLTVDDGFDTSTCSATVTLDDRRAPEIVPAATLELWPVNHKMVTVTPDMTLEAIEDACGAMGMGDVVVLAVTSDESFDMRGSGQTRPDVVIGCDGSVELRAERSGTADGRVYTITYAVTDADGNTSTADVEVHVPHDQSGRPAVAGPVMETVEADCD